MGVARNLQLPSCKVRGYSFSVANLTPVIHWTAEHVSPPLHPIFPFVAQSITCWTLSDSNFPLCSAFMLSTVSTVEKAQQAPHDFWCFTGVMMFFVRQSTFWGRGPEKDNARRIRKWLVFSSSLAWWCAWWWWWESPFDFSRSRIFWRISGRKYCARNSSGLRSAQVVRPHIA